MAKRGRPPKNKTVEQVSRAFRAEDYGIGLDGKPLPECPRKFFEDGSPNLGYFHWMLGRLSESLTNAAISGDKLPSSYKDAQVALLAEAEMVGFRPQQLFDRRSEGDKIEEAVSKLLDAPDSVLEVADDIVEVIRKEMDKVDSGCKNYIAEKCDEIDEALYEAAQEAASKAKKAARWKKVLESLLHVRARAKMPVPVRVPGVAPQDCDSLRAAHPLRFAIYIGRSNMAQFRTDASKPSDAILRFARHHCKMAVDIWAAENNCVWDPDGIRVHVPGIRYEGAIIVAPPGHGKSELGAHWAALRICNNPNEQGLIGHAQSGEAEKTLRYLRHCFDRETAVGRRVATMFPRIQLAKNENNVNSIKLEVGEVLKQPTVMAFGIRSKISGANASWIWFDDPVDQREVDSETDRDRTDRVIQGTWMTRLRGTKGTFHLTTTTLWHPDDANMRRIKLAREKKVWIYVSRQWCGGPTWYPSYGNRRHYGPLWPEMYPEEFLRKKYNAMRSPSLYAACYGSDPRTDSDKLVRKLRYYDPHTKEHQELIQSGLSKFYISVDPAATVRETSDPAGLLYAVWGDVTSKTQTETGVDVKRRPVIRILDARQFKATQTDLADEIALYSATQRVDHVIVETTAAFNATRELLQELHGIPSIGMPPTQNKSKGVRLRAVSVMMEDANTGPDVPPPVVEFPGVPNEKGEIVPDPRYDWFYRQIVDFGTGVSDHALDALTQLLILLGPEAGVGTGLVTEHIQQEMTRDSRVSRLLGMVREKKVEAAAGVEDLEFMLNLGGV